MALLLFYPLPRVSAVGCALRIINKPAVESPVGCALRTINKPAVERCAMRTLRGLQAGDESEFEDWDDIKGTL